MSTRENIRLIARAPLKSVVDMIIFSFKLIILSANSEDPICNI